MKIFNWISSNSPVFCIKYCLNTLKSIKNPAPYYPFILLHSTRSVLWSFLFSFFVVVLEASGPEGENSGDHKGWPAAKFFVSRNCVCGQDKRTPTWGPRTKQTGQDRTGEEPTRRTFRDGVSFCACVLRLVLSRPVSFGMPKTQKSDINGEEKKRNLCRLTIGRILFRRYCVAPSVACGYLSASN